MCGYFVTLANGSASAFFISLAALNVKAVAPQAFFNPAAGAGRGKAARRPGYTSLDLGVGAGGQYEGLDVLAFYRVAVEAVSDAQQAA